MPEILFDQTSTYEEMLNKGIGLSGENREYFVRGRLASLRRRLPSGFSPLRILDFGCGLGTTACCLAQEFQMAQVVGADTSDGALEHARAHYGSNRIHFVSIGQLDHLHPFDLCYTNGVFHHIRPKDRTTAVHLIHRLLENDGYLALFENNPWNPGTRVVMRRIPFDRDAAPISASESRRLLREGGFTRSSSTWSLFWFPRPLAFLRFAEDSLSPIPLGAQYGVLVPK